MCLCYCDRGWMGGGWISVLEAVSFTEVLSDMSQDSRMGGKGERQSSLN